MKKSSGFSLIEIIVAVAIIAILAGAIVPVLFNRLEQARYERTQQDLKTIYEASMGTPVEDYFGYVGDIGRLPDSIPELLDGTGQGSLWSGPYLSLGGGLIGRDIYGNPYVIDTLPIRVRTWGIDRTDGSGTGDDLFYPENALNTYKGQLEVQVYINGRLIADASTEQVTAFIDYAVNGNPTTAGLVFNASTMTFQLSSPLHQGMHSLTVNAGKAVVDPATSIIEQVRILAGATNRIQVTLEDGDYMTRNDTDLNGNGIPDREEDIDGDGIPDSMDQDIDGDGTPNAIDPDPLDPTVGGGGGEVAPVVSSVTPSFGYQGDTNLFLTIDGQYFDPGATVTFSSTGITVLTSPANYIGASQLTVNVNINASASTGFRDVTVTNTSGLGGTGQNLFEVLAAGGSPAPSITQIVPSSSTLAVTGLLISVQGQNFQSGSTVTFSEPNINITSGPTFINSNEVQVTVDILASASPGEVTVRLTNTDGKFAEAPFTILGASLFISQLNPNTAQRLSQNVLITITGSGFLNQAQVTTAGSSATKLSIDWYTWDSATQIRMQADCGWIGIDREVLVVVTNPGGTADTASFFVTR